MPKQIPTSIRIDESILHRLEELSNKTRRSKNNIIGLALERYLDAVDDEIINDPKNKEINEIRLTLQKLISRVNILTKQLDNTQKRITKIEKER